MDMGQGLKGIEALEILAQYYITGRIAARVLEIARTIGPKAEPFDQGYVGVTYSPTDGYKVYPRVYKGKIPIKSSPKVALTTSPEYSRTRKPKGHTNTQRTKEATMPRRAQAAEPEPEVEQEQEQDYTAYAGKDATPTMEHFGIWIIDEVFQGEYPDPKAEDAFLDGVRLGGTLRMEFQRSDYWRETREEIKREREEAKASSRKARTSAAAEEEEEEEADEAPDKPARRTRGAANNAADVVKPAAKPRGRAAAAPAETAAKAPARRGRGRAAAEAPF